MPESHQMGSRSTNSHQNTSNDSPQHTQIRRGSIRLSVTGNPQKTRTHTQQRVKVSPCTIRNRMENILCETNLPTLSEMRELNKVKTTIRIITNPRHPNRPFCVDPSKTLGKLQTDPRRTKKNTTTYHTTVDRNNERAI
jgi:hypothetical protein